MINSNAILIRDAEDLKGVLGNLGRSGRSVILAEIFPDAALELIKLTPSYQRIIRQSIVAKYASDMSAQKWKNGTANVILAENGALIDGQHSMHAIVLSNTSQVFSLKLGFEESDYSNIDQGVPRTITDAYRTIKMEYNTVRAPVIRDVLHNLIGYSFSTTGNARITAFKDSVELHFSFLELNPNFKNEYKDVFSIKSYGFPISKIKKSVMHLLHIAYVEKYQERANVAFRFIAEKLTTEEIVNYFGNYGFQIDAKVKEFRKYLERKDVYHLDKADYFSIFLKIINSIMKGETLPAVKKPRIDVGFDIIDFMKINIPEQIQDRVKKARVKNKLVA